VWSGYHIYQGIVPVCIHFVAGVVYGWAFVILKRLWPLVLAHAAFNAVSLVLRAGS